MTLSDLDSWLRGVLDLAAFQTIDSSRNGLQVSSTAADVRRVAFAVDASRETFRRAAEWGAGMLFVHHGIIWDRPERLVGTTYERVRFLVQKNLALYAVHLPLDQHPEVGNNIGIARHLGLTDVAPFGSYKGMKIGFRGKLAAPARLDDLVRRLPGRTLPFGPELIRQVGVVSGGAPWEVLQAVEEGLDLYITGEASHGIYHHCLESRIHVIFAGHYQSESFGVKALSEKLARETGLETAYIDVPTGL